MRGIRTIVTLLLAVLLSGAALSGQDNGAMLYAHGNVTLNGAALGQSSSIFVGDRLTTADSSVATINRVGSSVVVNPNSSVQYTQSSIEVMSGTARVSTLSGMSAQAGGVTITPKDGAAKFDVVQSSAGTVVTPREGALVVRDGNNTVSLQPGVSKVFAPTGLSSQTVADSKASDPIQTYETAMQPGLPVCPNVKYCFGRGSVSLITPCRCRP